MFRIQSVTARLVLVGALLAGAFCRIFVVFSDDGIYWPDEIYQSLEPAHRAVFGYGFTVWEFRHGARNWATPGVVAVIMATTKVLGVDSPDLYLAAIRLMFAALSMAAALGIFRLVRGLGGSEVAAAVGAATWSLAAPSIYFAHRALSENLAAASLIWAVALLLPRQASVRRLWCGASLLGLSVLFRLQIGLMAVGILGVLAARRRYTALKHVSVALAIWAFLYGALDAATWGHLSFARYGGWFHSAITYVYFNVVEGRSSDWGVFPASYYLTTVFRSMPLEALCLATGAIAALWSSRETAFLLVLFVGAHSAVGHKEYRFILPAIPLAIAAASVAFDRWPRHIRAVALSAMTIGAAWSASTFRSLSFADVGRAPDTSPGSAWDDSGSVNRLMLKANKIRDLCGLRIDVHPAWHGGSTYLHRRVHIYPEMPDRPRYFNYVISTDTPGMRIVSEDGKMKLATFVDSDGCQRDDLFDWGAAPGQ